MFSLYQHRSRGFFYGCWCLTYLTTFLLILPQACKENVYSKYFRMDPNDPKLVERAMRINSLRLAAAKRYLNTAILSVQSDQLKQNNTQWISNKSPTDTNKPSIAIGVMTTKRSVEKEHRATLGYLTQTLGSFHILSKRDKHFGDKHIFACNVDAESAGHREVELWHSLFDTEVRFPTAPEAIEPWQVFEKEKQDYQFCLKKATQYEADYVILVEDDAVPLHHFFETVSMAVNRLHHGTHPRDSIGVSSKPWGFLKLYYPERWAGYGIETRHLLELLFIGAIGGVISWAGYMLMTRNGRNRDVGQFAMVVSLGVIYAVLLVYLVGRPYVTGYMGRMWNFYWITPAKQCCTQAMLYPRDMTDRVLTYLDTVESDIDFSIDLALDTFITEHKLEAYMVEPNVIKHVGMFSSLRSYSRRVAEFI